jgi:purine-binding chemotaxis protein CheW
VGMIILDTFELVDNGVSYNGRVIYSTRTRESLTGNGWVVSVADEKVLLVRLGKDLYAIPIAVIEEVLPALPIEAVPQCPDFVRGVIFVRGHLIPVLSAAERLGWKSHQLPDDPTIVCIRVGKRRIGVEFDEALDLMDLATANVLPSSEIGAREGFCTGVIERDGQFIRLLDPEKLTSQEETQRWLGADQG